MNIEKIKEHFKKHKEAYIAGASCGIVFAGITMYIMRKQCLFSGMGTAADGKGLGTAESKMNIVSSSLSNSLNNTNITNNFGKKQLSYLITTEGRDAPWLSQNAVARDTGIDKADISRHLNWGKPLPGGLELSRIGIAPAA